MSGRLEGRCAIITGAGDGIGAATARRFVAEGCRVVVTDRSGKASALVDELGSERVVYERMDLSSAELVPNLVEIALGAFGQLDIVVANAGVMPDGSIEDHTLEDFRLALEVNSVSTFLLVQAAVRRMERGASVIIVSSVQALQGHARRVGYNASKGALIAMTRSMALDVAPRGIRVNVVCPGAIDAPMYRDYLAATEDPRAVERKIIQQHPLGRIGQPPEVANAILFLASDEASFMTGVVLPVDGGYTMAKT